MPGRTIARASPSLFPYYLNELFCGRFLPDRRPFFGTNFPSYMEGESIYEELADQRAPADNVRASSRMKNGQARVAQSPANFGKAEKNVAVFARYQLFVVTAYFIEHLLAKHLELTPGDFPFVQDIVLK